jgi:hypothetical protein
LASGLAGAKAGAIGAAFFAAAAGAFDAVVLEVFKSSVIASMVSAGVCTATPESCFSTLVGLDVLLLVILPVAVCGLLFGTLYGMYFEFFPGGGYTSRAAAVGMVMLVVILFFGLGGIAADATQGLLVRLFDLVAMVGYVLILARFYRRYTREVRFESSGGRVTVDRKDWTGKTKTLRIHSSHSISAPNEKGAFHAWLVSGGVSVADPKSLETTIKVDGDGLLKLS